jgi:flagellar motor switch protein FliN/FliY
MITPDTLADHAPQGQEAVASFLETILGERLPIEIDGPTRIQSDILDDQFERCYAILGRSRESEPFVVLVDMEWLPFLSQAMLGNKLTEWNDEADEFLNEIATQVHATLQQKLAETEITLPDANFTILPEVVSLPSELLADELQQLSITLNTAEKHIEAHLLLSMAEDESEEGPNAPDAEEQPLPGTQNSPKEASTGISSEGTEGPGAGDPSAQAASPDPASELGGEPDDEAAVDVAYPSFPDFDDSPDISGGMDEAEKFELLGDVEIELAVELGRRQMPLEDILRLTNGSIVELDKLAGEPLQIYANNRLIAEGEAVVIDDQFGVRITRLASSKKRARALL